MGARFEVYPDTGAAYRWRLVAANGRKIAASGESFSSASAADDAARNVKVVAPTAPIVRI